MTSNDTSRLHMRYGWWALLVFLTLGLVLEGLHGLKVGWYLDVSTQTRRLMWTLAHAHGTLLAMINIAFSLTVSAAQTPAQGFAGASRLLMAATVLLPMGFFTGGIFIHSGDPGLGIVLVPVGGVVLFLGVLMTARALGRAPAPEVSTEQSSKGRTKKKERSSRR